jgi:hypothetical protein
MGENCNSCNTEISQINFCEKGTYEVKDSEIIAGGGVMSVTCATCGTVLTEDQCIKFGILE